MGLPRYQVYAAFQCGGKNTGWVQGRTLPPPPAIRDAADLKARSQNTYGIPSEQVEAEYLKLFADDRVPEEEWTDAGIGRRKRL